MRAGVASAWLVGRYLPLGARRGRCRRSHLLLELHDHHQNKTAHLHEKLAIKYFKALFESGVRIAQLRTRLGIPGFETKGPESAAEALFEVISK